jgi:hypothetical protein
VEKFALSSVDELAAFVASAEKDEALTPSESQRRLKKAIERCYTSPHSEHDQHRNYCPKDYPPGPRG